MHSLYFKFSLLRNLDTEPGKQMKNLIRFFPIAIACLMPPAVLGTHTPTVVLVHRSVSFSTVRMLGIPLSAE